ncbi:hypothetical protein AcV5_000498 [Taiwanofungus camphoratus]|nr:hypothetical protein AcV5_000498 [Antrodia cinnamomea]
MTQKSQSHPWLEKFACSRRQALELLRAAASSFFDFLSAMATLLYRDLFLLCFPSLYAPSYTRLQKFRDAYSIQLGRSDFDEFGPKWYHFSKGLTTQYKNMNILSGLLLSAAVGLLQVFNVSDNWPTNTVGIVTLINALISLLFGIVYQIHLSSLTSERHGVIWLESTAKVASPAWIGALLSIPAAWLMWSIGSLLTLILVYVWIEPAQEGTGSAGIMPLPARLLITSVFCFGLAHLVVAAIIIIRLNIACRSMAKNEEKV